MFIKDFNLFKKQCCHNFWSVEKNTEIKNPKVAATKKGRKMLLSKREVCDNKNQNLSKSKKLVDH